MPVSMGPDWKMCVAVVVVVVVVVFSFKIYSQLGST